MITSNAKQDYDDRNGTEQLPTQDKLYTRSNAVSLACPNVVHSFSMHASFSLHALLKCGIMLNDCYHM